MEPAPKGHNNPPDPIDEALAPYGDTITEAETWLDGSPVENEGQMAAVDVLTTDIKAALKAVENARDYECRPLHDAWKAAIARFKPTQDDLTRIRDGLVAANAAFKKRLLAQQEAERKRAWEAAREAERAAEEAARKANASDIEAQRAAEAAALEAKIAATNASKAKPSVKGMRTVQRHEIVDHRASLHWIAKNDREAVTAFIEAYAEKNHAKMPDDCVRSWSEKVAF